LSSREDVANKGGHHYKQEENNAYVSCLFVEVGAVIKSSSDMHIDADEEEGCAVGVHISD